MVKLSALWSYYSQSESDAWEFLPVSSMEITLLLGIGENSNKKGS